VPKVVVQALMLLGSTAFAAAGVWMLTFPESAVRRLEKYRDDSMSNQSRWTTRFIGAVLLFFAWAGYHLVLIDGLRPPDPDDGLGV
jgi:hypothetical protein